MTAPRWNRPGGTDRDVNAVTVGDSQTISGDKTHTGKVVVKGVEVANSVTVSAVPGAGGVAQLDLTFAVGSGIKTGYARVVILVRGSTNAALQAHFDLPLLTVNAGTSGAATAATLAYDGSLGDFKVAASDVTVTRPSTGVVRVSFLNRNTGNVADDVTFLVLDAVNLTSISTATLAVVLPSGPTNVGASRGNASATVTWTAPVIGGGAPTNAWRIKPHIAGVAQAATVVPDSSGTLRSHTVTGLTNGTAYTFTVEASNNGGSTWGTASDHSPAVIPASVPSTASAPTIAAGTVTGTLTVTPAAYPAANGDAVLGWEYEPFHAGVAQAKQRFAGTGPHTLTAQPTGVALTVKAAAYNSVGVGAQSAASNSVTLTGPTVTPTVTLVVGDPASLTTGDSAIQSRLTGRGWSVTLVDDDSSADTTSRSLTVISESCSSASIGTKYSTLAQGAVLMESFVADSWNLATADPGAFINPPSARVHTAHAAAGGLAVGTYSLASTGDLAQFPVANIPAAADRFLTDNATPTNVVGFAVESGASILNGATAAARRIMLGYQGTMLAGTPTANAWTIFDACCDWVKGTGGGSVGGTALMVVGNTTLSTGDAAIKTRLEALAYTVTTIAAATAESGTAYTVGVVTPTATGAGTKYRGKTYPILMMCGSLWDEWNAATGTNVGTWPMNTGYVLSTHTANGGLSVGFHTWAPSGDQTQHGPESVAPNGTKLQVEDPDPAYHNVRAMSVESGVTMLNSFAAPARRIFNGWSDGLIAAGLTADGISAFAGWLNWLVPGPASAPNAPASMTLTVRDSTSVTASWPAPSNGGADIIDYEVKLWRQNDGVLVYTNADVTTTSHIVTGLTTGVAVYGQVRARNVVSYGAGSPFSAAVTPSGTVATGRKTVGLHGYEGWADAAINGGHGTEFDLYVLQAWEWDRIPMIKAANPNAIVCCYKDFTLRPGGVGGYDASGYPLFATMADSNAAPESWYLHNGGNRLYLAGWEALNVYFADIGNTDYRAHCVSHLIAELQRNGWDGIFQDNAAMNFVPGYGVPDAYPSTAAWKVPLFAFLGVLAPALSAAGKYHIMNQGSTSFTETEIGQQLDACGSSPLTGGCWEYWGNWHHEPGQPVDPYWVGVAMSWMKASMDRDRPFLALGMSTAYGDTRLMRYERAMFLIEWDGTTRAWLALHREHNSPIDVYHPEYAIDIGVPSGATFNVGAGLRRNYTGGTVLLNANDFSQNFPLGATYYYPDGTPTSSPTLGAREGLILRSS